MSNTKKLVSFDWAINRLLRNKASFGIFEGFLSELLREDIKIKSLLESESNRETKDDRSNRVDSRSARCRSFGGVISKVCRKNKVSQGISKKDILELNSIQQELFFSTTSRIKNGK
jgi:hypothetical protein